MNSNINKIINKCSLYLSNVELEELVNYIVNLKKDIYILTVESTDWEDKYYILQKELEILRGERYEK